MLFERATFLVISNAVRTAHSDVHRFEKAQRAFVRSQTSQGLQVSPRNPFPAAANRQPLAAK